MNSAQPHHPPINQLAVLRLAVSAFLMSALIGCSGSHELETAKVSGLVTLDGKPMTQGTVMFVPEIGRAGSGVIGADGSYQLTTYKPDDGALVGHHKISVAIPEGSETRSARAIAAIPRRYMSAESSGLTFE
jgi:hypothetical protein